MLSEATIYLASSPKSNSSYKAIDDAMFFIRESESQPVPLHLRNAPTNLMKKAGYGKDYKYAHSYENNFVEEEFLPEQIRTKIIYNPQNNSKEKEIREKLSKFWIFTQNLLIY